MQRTIYRPCKLFDPIFHRDLRALLSVGLYEYDRRLVLEEARLLGSPLQLDDSLTRNTLLRQDSPAFTDSFNWLAIFISFDCISQDTSIQPESSQKIARESGLVPDHRYARDDSFILDSA